MKERLQKLWFKLQVAYGSRCACGGRMEPVPGQPQYECSDCHKTIKA